MDVPDTPEEMEKEIEAQLVRDETRDVQVEWDGAYLVFADLRRNTTSGDRYMPCSQHEDIVDSLRAIIMDTFDVLKELRADKRDCDDLEDERDDLREQLKKVHDGLEPLREALAPMYDGMRALFENKE